MTAVNEREAKPGLPTRRRVDEIVTLADGRAIGMAHFGDPHGKPVFFFHGTPGTRFEATFGDEPAAAAGIHLVALDRPGYGLSDFAPGRSYGSWPADVTEVADALGFERFGVVGVSGGGPYVLACAARIPQRLTGAVVVSGAIHLDAPGTNEAFKRNMIVFKIGRYAPFFTRGLLWKMARDNRKNPDSLREHLLKVVGPGDRKILERREVTDLLGQDQVEAFRHGTRGMAHESKMFLIPWDFRLEDIQARVHVWQGEEDIQSAPETARWILSKLSDGVPHFIPDAGHYMIVDQFPAILAAAVGDPVE